MELRQYMAIDKEMINTWYYSRKQEYLPLEQLPKIGYIVPNVAAGFLIQTDNTFCIFEPFITNPEIPKDIRSNALDIIIEELLKTAKQLNYKSVFGFSTSVPMINRGLKHGFSIQEINSTTIFREIK